FFVGSGMDKAGAPFAIQRIDALDMCRSGASAVAIKYPVEVLQDVAVVLFRKAQEPAAVVEIQQEVFVNRRHVDNSYTDARIRQAPGCGQSFMNAASTADNGGDVRGTLTENGPFAKFEFIVAFVKNRRTGSHHANVNEPPVTLHDPLHDGEHLSRAGHVDNLQLADGIEDQVVVI